VSRVAERRAAIGGRHVERLLRQASLPAGAEGRQLCRKIRRLHHGRAAGYQTVVFTGRHRCHRLSLEGAIECPAGQQVGTQRRPQVAGESRAPAASAVALSASAASLAELLFFAPTTTVRSPTSLTSTSAVVPVARVVPAAGDDHPGYGREA
jgi:hypothetical protein